MANQIRPLARLFRGMADLIDQDHTSQTRYEAIAKAAGVVAAPATAEELVAGRLWQVDGADLLASAYAFHAGLPRQAATAAHVQAMQAGPGPAGAHLQSPWSTRPGSVGASMSDPGPWTVPLGGTDSTDDCIR
jgi:ATP phosphoribosyltransferase regulatory subunit HisZ